MKKTQRREYILISAVTVANNFIRKGKEENISITPLKLQKLVYFLYKRYLQKTGDKLFSEQFETWKYGPVVPSIYTEFSTYGDDPIKSFAQDSQGNCYVVTEEGSFKEAFDYVWSTYKNYSGMSLSSLTHQPNTAWSKAKEAERQYLTDEEINNEQELK